MKITIAFRDDEARRTLYFLQHRYKSKAGLAKLAKVAILSESVAQAKIELTSAVEEKERRE